MICRENVIFINYLSLAIFPLYIYTMLLINIISLVIFLCAYDTHVLNCTHCTKKMYTKKAITTINGELQGHLSTFLSLHMTWKSQNGKYWDHTRNHYVLIETIRNVLTMATVTQNEQQDYHKHIKHITNISQATQTQCLCYGGVQN